MFGLCRNKNPNGLTSIILHPSGTVVTRIGNIQNAQPHLQLCEFLPGLANSEENTPALKALIREHGLGNAPCSTILGIGDYHLLLVEAPDVPPHELKAALRWRIRDLIDFQIDDAAIDVFEAPGGSAGGVQERVYVVVTRDTTVRQRVDQLLAAGARPEIVDIPELALRNIAARLPESDRGIALLYLEEERGLITLTRDSTLYLARSLDIGYRHLQQAPDNDTQLALEIQRSMDYYDRHFQQAPINSIALFPLPEPGCKLGESLKQQLGLSVREVKAEDIMQLEAPLPERKNLSLCMLAAGAALRYVAAA